jgi:CspA family cold shock protein
MTTPGRVRTWHDDEGWGVVDSEASPGGCWVHASAVLVPGYRSLRVGQEVLLDFETAEQDGYTFRATEVWPSDQDPVRAAPVSAARSTAYRSSLTLTFDDGSEPEHRSG